MFQFNKMSAYLVAVFNRKKISSFYFDYIKMLPCLKQCLKMEHRSRPGWINQKLFQAHPSLPSIFESSLSCRAFISPLTARNFGYAHPKIVHTQQEAAWVEWGLFSSEGSGPLYSGKSVGRVPVPTRETCDISRLPFHWQPLPTRTVKAGWPSPALSPEWAINKQCWLNDCLSTRHSGPGLWSLICRSIWGDLPFWKFYKHF